MAIGSVSTPSRTTVQPPTKAGANAAPDADAKPKSDGSPPATTPSDAQAIASRLTRERLDAGAAVELVRRAGEGDGRTGSSTSSNPLRRDGTHVGSRDARISAIESERAELHRFAGRAPDQAKADEMRADAADLQQVIRGSRGMNAVADTLYVLGADRAKVEVLEDEERVRVVPDSQLAGSAAYDKTTDSILVAQSVADRAASIADDLLRQGVLDYRGRIITGREEELDASPLGDELVKIGTLITYHEQLHADQHEHGHLEFDASTDQRVLMEMDRYEQHVRRLEERGLGGEHASDWENSDMAWSIEEQRIDVEEYDAYLAQEQADLELGASLRVQLVTDVDGTPLERWKAVDNIADMERGRPLRHGPDAGWVRADVLRKAVERSGVGVAAVPWGAAEIARHGSTIMSETPGWKRPGWKRPGWKRPGHLME